MDEIKGLYINLEEDTERNKALCQKIESSNINYNFTRHSAIKGDADEARDRGLSPGELGIWKTWLEILKRKQITQIENIDICILLKTMQDWGKIRKTADYLQNTQQGRYNNDGYVRKPIAI